MDIIANHKGWAIKENTVSGHLFAVKEDRCIEHTAMSNSSDAALRALKAKINVDEKITLPRKYAPSFTKLSSEDTGEQERIDNCVRLYKSSPEGASLQIRGRVGMESTKTYKTGNPACYIATVNYLSVEDLQALQVAISVCIAAIEE